MSESNSNDIAIVGMALRVPGANTLDEYWRNLRDGVESITPLTEEELLAAGESKDRLHHKNYVKSAAILDRMEMFDGEFFGFSPKESAIMDPQHRHFLEVAWEAFEDAGRTPERFEGPVGVFAGCGMGSYFYFNVCSNRDLVDSVGMFLLRHTGNDKDFLATRLSYALNLTGPSVNVQTACSTSLVAVHYATQSLLSHECDMALAGGVTIELPHRRGYIFQDGEILSPDGHCHAFDHRAQGTVFGSGAGVVVLRRLEDAINDGDRIHAVIKATAVNNDGARKAGYLAPSVDGQAAAVAEAIELADISADTIGYVECHGTGTYLGDPIEVAALTQAFRQSTDKKGFCRIGSVKTNIGHLDTAAGVASLIKATMAVSQGEMPPSLGFEKPNPTIDFEDSPFVVNDALTSWSSEQGPRRASINSLGVGGTNAHAVIEQAPSRQAVSKAKRNAQVLVVSGRSRGAVNDASERLAAHLRAHPEQPLADVAFSLHHGRRDFDVRRVVAATTHEEAARLLEEKDSRRVFTHTASVEAPEVIFMFPGGGAQYAGMGRELYDTEPVFREVVDQGLAVLQPKLDYDIKKLMFATQPDEVRNADEAFRRPSVQLPAILIMEVALAKLWMSYGVKPAALIGHSMGENTAACLAGVLSFENAIELVYLRGKLFDTVPAGGMLSVPLGADELRPYLKVHEALDLACVNSPELSVASGPDEALEALDRALREQGIEPQRIAIDIAAHSRMLDGILPDFEAFLRSIELRAPEIPTISNRTGTWLTAEQATDPAYWVEHLRRTVHFSDGIVTLCEQPGRIFLEVGPGKAMSSLAKQHSQVTTQNVFSVLRHPEESIGDDVYHLQTLGRLWACGGRFDWGLLWAGETRHRISLPTYAFQHKPYFIEPGVLEIAPQTSLTKEERIERWGYVPVWKKRFAELETVLANEPVVSEDGSSDDAAQAKRTWLVFMDDVGIGLRVKARLRAAGDTVVTVVPGDAYAQRSDTEYVLSPERGAEGYKALVRDLVAIGKVPSHVVHLWLVTGTETFRPGSNFFHRNLERGFYSLLFLAQAIGDESVPRPLHLSVVSSGMQRVAEESLTYPEKATALGPCKVIPREFPGITCTSIDLELPPSSRLPVFDSSSLGNSSLGNSSLGNSSLGSSSLGMQEPRAAKPSGFGGEVAAGAVDLLRSVTGLKSRDERLEQLTDQLLEDLHSVPTNSVVAYRSGVRWEQTYAPRVLPSAADAAPISPDSMPTRRSQSRETPLRDGGVYLITGGLGGLGLVFADYLAKTCQARLVLVGRTPLPARSEWDEWLRTHGDRDVTSRRILSVRELEAAGARVMVAAADVTDLEEMSRVRDRAHEEFGAIHGVLHAAGLIRDNLIPLKDVAEAEQVFTPKVHGTLVLDALFEDGELDFCVLFSSTSSAIAPVGQVDYVAANAFLNAFAQSRSGTQTHTVALNWGIWNEVGMAAEAMADKSSSGPSEEALSLPFFDRRLRDPQGRSTLSRRYSPRTDWILDEHRTRDGHALIPGTGYLEMAAQALLAHGERGGFELQDMFFLRPLTISDEEPAREVRAKLRRSDEGYLFELRSAVEFEGRAGWQLHAQGGVSLVDLRETPPIDLEQIAARCTKIDDVAESSSLRSPQEAHLRFGGRWRVLRRARYGNGEALADLELPPEYAGDFDEGYRIHPGLMDLATGYAMNLIEGYEGENLWVPVSYRRVRVHAPLKSKIRSWVRGGRSSTSGAEDADFASFDIVIADELGNVLIEVDDFVIRRMAGGRVDFALAAQPTASEVAFDSDAGSEQALSPAEEQLLANMEQGIRPAEGVEAFARVLRQPEPEILISSLDLPGLIRQAEHTLAAEEGSSAKFARPELDSEYVAPRDEIERTLVGLWEELLGVEQVGVQDSFFDLGGHSLIAVRLFSKIKRAYQAEFPISVLFEAPTIEACAHLIRETIGESDTDESSAPTHRTRYTHLVAMHTGDGGAQNPFFLVAGMFGNVLNLRHLAHLVGTDRPFYGLQARGLYGDQEPHQTFEDMARDYIAELRTVQPHGPYMLGGFSGGGITAYEMAQQLIADGEDVSMLLLLDTPLPEANRAVFRDRVAIHLQSLKSQGSSYVSDWARGKLEWELEQLAKRFSEPVEQEASEFHNDAIEAAFRAALGRYQIRPYDGSVILYRPKLDDVFRVGGGRMLNSEREYVYEDNGWSSLVKQVDVHEVPGDHDSMVLEPNVRTMAALLRKHIEDAERAQRATELAASSGTNGSPTDFGSRGLSHASAPSSRTGEPSQAAAHASPAAAE